MLNHGFVYREEIDAGGEGRTVLHFLAMKYPRASEPEWTARIEAGQVQLRDATAHSADQLRCGDTLSWHRPAWDEPDVPLEFDVLFEDDHLLAVSKPSGLPTIPGGGFLEHTLLHQVRIHHPDASPMHRLGRGTSGIVLFAKTPASRAAMQSAWREHRVKKIYRALATGRVQSERFTIDLPIGLVPHAKLGELFAIRPGGKPSVSHVTLIEQREADSLVDVEIDTGRPHQIRIHLAAVGHPLVGDPLYAIGGVPLDTALPGDLGYLLHAARLEFVHPATGAKMIIESQPPPSLRQSRSS